MAPAKLLLLDSDLFVLLAGGGLLEDLIAAAGFEVSQARRLDPLPHMLRRGPLRRRYSEAVLQRAEAWCAQVRPVVTEPRADLLQSLVAIGAIDPGEALLFAHAAGGEHDVVATGDLRACCAFAAAPDVADLRNRLEGRLICLEVALELLRRRLDHGMLMERLALMRDTNATLRVLLPQGLLTGEADFREGLLSYLRDATSKLGALLLRPA